MKTATTDFRHHQDTYDDQIATLKAELNIIDRIFEQQIGEQEMNGFIEAREASFKIHSGINKIRQLASEVFDHPPHFLESCYYDNFWRNKELPKRVIRLKTYGDAAGRAADKLFSGEESAMEEAWDAGYDIAASAAIGSASELVWYELECNTFSSLLGIEFILTYCCENSPWRGPAAMKYEFVRDALKQLAITTLKFSALEITIEAMRTALDERRTNLCETRNRVLEYMSVEALPLAQKHRSAYKEFTRNAAYELIITSGAAPDEWKKDAVYHLKSCEPYDPPYSEEATTEVLAIIDEARELVTPGAIATIAAWKAAIDRYTLDDLIC